MIILKTDYVTIQCEEGLNLLEVEWHGLIRSEEFRETLKLILELIQEKKMKYFLVDRKDMQRISLADEEWRRKHWFPKFLKSGVTKAASVVSKDYYNEVSVARLIEEEDKDITIQRKSFYNYQAAKNWLLQHVYIEKDNPAKR